MFFCKSKLFNFAHNSASNLKVYEYWNENFNKLKCILWKLTMLLKWFECVSEIVISNGLIGATIWRAIGEIWQVNLSQRRRKKEFKKKQENYIFQIAFESV